MGRVFIHDENIPVNVEHKDHFDWIKDRSEFSKKTKISTRIVSGSVIYELAF